MSELTNDGPDIYKINRFPVSDDVVNCVLCNSVHVGHGWQWQCSFLGEPCAANDFDAPEGEMCIRDDCPCLNGGLLLRVVP